MQVTDVAPGAFDCPDVDGVGELLVTFLAPAGPHVTDGECCDGLLALDRLRNQTDAALCAAVDRFDARQVHVGDGMGSAVAWLRSRTELSRGEATALVRQARALRTCPAVRTAYADGVIGSAKVRAMLRARTGVETLFAAHEAALVTAIRDLSVEQARGALLAWRRMAIATVGDPDPDGPAPDPEDANRLHLSQTLDDRWKLDGDLDAVSGEIVANALAAVVDQMFRSGTARSGDGVLRSHRNAQALVELVEHGSRPGTKGGQARPSVSLDIDLAELTGTPADTPAEAMARRCHLTSGARIGRATAERLLCAADVTSILTETGLDGIVEILGAAHTNRYPSATERRALARRDQGCVFPGCHAPVDRTDAHHLDHWHLHGTTELHRLVLLCRYHHHCVHEGGFTLDRTRSGVVTVTRPDGTRLPRAGPGHLALEDPIDHTPLPAAPTAGPRTASRFRSLAQRLDREQREELWWRQRMLARLRRDGLDRPAARWTTADAQ